MERKWFNFCTGTQSLTDALRGFLKENAIKYELSDASVGGYPFWHFEIFVNAEERAMVDGFLDEQYKEEVA